MSKMICFNYKFCFIYSIFTKYREDESVHDVIIIMTNVVVQLKLMPVATWQQGDGPFFRFLLPLLRGVSQLSTVSLYKKACGTICFPFSFSVSWGPGLGLGLKLGFRGSPVGSLHLFPVSVLVLSTLLEPRPGLTLHSPGVSRDGLQDNPHPTPGPHSGRSRRKSMA